MKRESLLKLIKDKKLNVDICITGEYVVYISDTGKVVFKGHPDTFLSTKLGLKFMVDYRM